MKITLLGTGNAQATACFNTCFVMDDGNSPILVDGGGGNELIVRLKKAGYDWKDMRHIIVTHKHIDHLLGIIWMLRFILQGMSRGKYEGEAYLYGHDEVIALLKQLADLLLLPKETRYINDRFHFIAVNDGETLNICDHPVTFFDIGSDKAKQYGFTLRLADGRKITCCGDEPYCEREYEYAKDSALLMHEAFCLYSEKDIFEPYKKNHSTVKDACELAESLHVGRLLLYHTEDKNYARRKELYGSEGRQYYHGELLIPYDMEEISV